MRRSAPWLLALGGAAALALWHWADGPGPTAADYAQYLAHARALADGRPYTDTGYIFTSLYPYAGPAAQPPGLPLVLALVFLTFGESMLAVKVLLLAFALSFYFVAGRYFAGHDDVRLGLAVTLLLGLSSEAGHWSTIVQSDLPFCALAWGVIHLYDRDGPFTTRRILAITVLGAATLLFRTFGIALVPASALFAVLQYRRHGLKPAVPVAVWGAAFLVANAVFPITAGFAPRLGAFLASLPRTVFNHTLSYRFALFGAHLYPFPWGPANDVYHVLAAIVMLIGLAVWCRTSWSRFAVVFAVTYVGMLMVIPVLDIRYMWPVHPILAFGFVQGLAVLRGRIRPGGLPEHRTRFALGCAVAVGVLSVASSERAIQRQPTFAGLADVQDVFRGLTRLAAESPMRVAFVRPQVLALETGIPSMTTFEAPAPVVLGELDRMCITHVVLGDVGLAPRADSAFRAVVGLHPDDFRLEYRNATFEVYRYAALHCRRDLRRRGGPAR